MSARPCVLTNFDNPGQYPLPGRNEPMVIRPVNHGSLQRAFIDTFLVGAAASGAAAFTYMKRADLAVLAGAAAMAFAYAARKEFLDAQKPNSIEQRFYVEGSKLHTQLIDTRKGMTLEKKNFDINRLSVENRVGYGIYITDSYSVGLKPNIVIIGDQFLLTPKQTDLITTRLQTVVQYYKQKRIIDPTTEMRSPAAA